MGAVHALRIKSPYNLLHVEDIKIDCHPNEHGTLYLKCLIDDSINFKYSIEASTNDEITVYEEKESKINSLEPDINKVNLDNSVVLFNGIINSIRTTNLNGLYYIEINGISKSSKMDIEEKSRSYQNVGMTYDDLIKDVLKDYDLKGFCQYAGCGQAIGKPIFQYKETDWNFLKRLASELNTEIYCDIINPANMLYFGRNEGNTYNVADDIEYKACKDLKTFYLTEGKESTDYFYYEINTVDRYCLGDYVNFKNKKLYVSEYSAQKIQDEVIYKYKLRRKNGVWFTKISNDKIIGASIKGEILDTRGEEVKLHLDIDKKQNEGEASWFRFAAATGNTMYAMPVKGTSARLYFPDGGDGEPLVSGCVRNNGASCAKTSDTSKRYFGTEHGSEVEMTPSGFNLKGGSSSLSISMDDATGVKITSPKKLTLSADSDIIMKTPNKVTINGVSQINAQKTNSQSGFSFESDLHFLSDNIIKNGNDSESYPDFDDEPEEGQMPPPPDPPEKKGFNWGGLLVAAVAAVAVVASVATFGVGAVVGAALVGAAIGAVCSAASTAANGGSFSDCVKSAVRGAFTGAVTGAIFGPLGGVLKGIKGAIALGGLFGMGDSLLNQAIDGKFSLGKTLLDGLIGSAMGGMFHGLGSLAKKFSPYIKSGIGKVLGKLSSGAKNILGKISEKAGNLVSAFKNTCKNLFEKTSNKFRNVVSAIKNGSKELYQKVSGKINDVVSDIKSSARNLYEEVSEKIYEASEKFNEVAQKIDNKLEEVLPDSVKTARDNFRRNLGLDDPQFAFEGGPNNYFNEENNYFDNGINKIEENEKAVGGKSTELNNKKSINIDKEDKIFEQLKENKNLTPQMIKELKDGMDDGRFSFTKIDSTDGQYKIDVYKLDSKLKPIKEIETTVVLDNSGNTVSVEWEVTGGGKRGTGYKKANVGEYDKGHIKSVQDGAKDNCIEDSPINIIPQSYDVNHSAMRRFEIYRTKKCKDTKVITEIIDDKHVRVKIPEKGIDVIYNPKSTKSKKWPKDWFAPKNSGKYFE